MSSRKFLLAASKSLCTCTKNAPPKFTKVTHVIFDLDGLLLDSESYKQKVMSILAECYEKKYTEDLFTKWVGKPTRDALQVFIKELGLDMKLEKVFEDYSKLAKDFRINCPLMPGAKQIVNHLHKTGIPMAIASNSDLKSYKEKTQKHEELFSKIHHYTLSDNDPSVENPKPCPEMYLVCARRFDESPRPEKCLAIEDSYTGVSAAVGAGMQCVMVPDYHTGPELRKQATLVVTSLSEVPLECFGLLAMT